MHFKPLLPGFPVQPVPEADAGEIQTNAAAPMTTATVSTLIGQASLFNVRLP
jgi:hypothetical protein